MGFVRSLDYGSPHSEWGGTAQYDEVIFNVISVSLIYLSKIRVKKMMVYENKFIVLLNTVLMLTHILMFAN